MVDVKEACNALSNIKDIIATPALIPAKTKRKNSHKIIHTLAFLDPGSTTTICSEKNNECDRRYRDKGSHIS